MAQLKRMESSNSMLMVIGGAFAVFLNWMLADVHWVLGGVVKGLMSMLYGGVGAFGAWLAKKYIISPIERRGGFVVWFKSIVKREKHHDDEEAPKQ